MEYEISDRPQQGEADAFRRSAFHLQTELMPSSLVASRRAEKHDRAIAIPEQEAGS
jgi:hypothetical protein